MLPTSISVVIPTWNSCSYLDKTLRTVVDALAEVKTLQVVVVDDGSSDNTFEIAEETLGGLPQVSYVIIQLAKNLGQSAATAVGLSHSVGDAVVTLDDDLSLAPDQIFELLGSLSDSVDFVVGAPHRYQNSATRRFFSEIARRLAVRAFGVPRHFVLTSFMAFQRKFLLRLDLPSIRVDEIGWMFQFTSRYLNSTVKSTIGIRKETTYGVRTLLKTAKPLIVPLVAFIGAISRWISALFAILAALLSLIYLYRALAIGGLQPGFPTVAVLLLLNSAIISILLALQLSLIVAIRNLRKPNVFIMQRRIATRV